MAMSIEQLIQNIGARTIARVIANPINEQAMNSSLDFEELKDFAGFRRSIGRYYNDLHGGRFSTEDAEGMAIQIIEREYHDHGGNIVSAFHDAAEGTQGGVIAQRMLIKDAIIREKTEHYVNDQFDRFADRSSWPALVEAVRAFIAYCGNDLVGLIDPDHPECHAKDFRTLVRAYVSSLQRNAALFRRL